MTGFTVDADGNTTVKTVNALTLSALASGFSVAGGTTPYTLTVDETKNLSHYLLADGSRNLTGNLSVDAGITIDDVDVDEHNFALGTGQVVM